MIKKNQLYDIKYEMYNILGINWNESSSYLSMDELLGDFNIKLNNIITSYVKENKKNFMKVLKTIILMLKKEIFINILSIILIILIIKVIIR